MSGNKQGIIADQTGMVAIVVTSVLMIVISIMVIGFTQTVRRQQRSALDNQLSTQAFYAAESGINLGKKDITTAVSGGATSFSKINCNQNTGITATTSVGASVPVPEPTYSIDPTTGSAVTCLLINDTVPTVNFQNVGTTGKVSKLQAANGLAINSTTFSWESASAAGFSACSSYPNLPKTWSPSCSDPILRVDVVPVGNGTGLSQSMLQNRQFTAFLYPNGNNPSPTSVTYASNAGAGSPQRLFPVNCSGAPTGGNLRCTAQVDLSLLPSQQVVIRVMALYGDANIQISVGTSGGTTPIKGAQYIVDSTARAVDVIRRLQARVEINPGTPADFTIEGGGGAPVGGSDATICKQFKVWVGQTHGCYLP